MRWDLKRQQPFDCNFHDRLSAQRTALSLPVFSEAGSNIQARMDGHIFHDSSSPFCHSIPRGRFRASQSQARSFELNWSRLRHPASNVGGGGTRDANCRLIIGLQTDLISRYDGREALTIPPVTGLGV